MSAVVRHDEEAGGYLFHCQGCGDLHFVAVDRTLRNGARWTFSGDEVRPTFRPSVRHSMEYRDGRPSKVCHYFVTDGRMEFCGDCTHALAGRTVEMKPVEAR